MPKTLLVSTDLDNKFYSALAAGNYTYPQQVTIDGYGRIATITTASGYVQPATLGAISGTSGRITVSTSTGSVVADLVAISTAGTYLYPNQMNIDSYGRFTSISTATPTYVSTTYSSIITLTVDNYGKVSTVTTGTSISIRYTPTRTYITSGTINGLTINVPFEYWRTFNFSSSNTWTYTTSVLDASVFINPGLYLTTDWAMEFTDVPAFTDRSISLMTIMENYNYGFSTATTTNTNSISINGVNSTVKWLDGRPPYGYTATTIVNYNIFYDGSVYTTYASEAAYW
jgi:hypothetical protein